MFKRNKLELKPLPMNMPEFNDWAGRIITKAKVPTKSLDSLKFVLASLIAQTPPHEFFRPDEYYINCLRKAAADQLAVQVMEDIKASRNKKTSEATQNQGVVIEGQKA